MKKDHSTPATVPMKPLARQAEINLLDRQGIVYRLSLCTFGHVGEHKVTLFERTKGGSVSLSAAFDGAFDARMRLLNELRYNPDIKALLELTEKLTKPRLQAVLVTLIEQSGDDHLVYDSEVGQ